MSESVETTLEEASRCPKCQNPGRIQGERQLTAGLGKLKVFVCENTRCQWYTTTWTVQVTSSGTIPPPSTSRQKQFRPQPDDDGRVLRGLQNQLNLETKPGAEVSRH